jgi:hypothetical protein
LAGVNSASGAADVLAVSLDQLADFASLVSGVGPVSATAPPNRTSSRYELYAVGVGE